MATRLILTLLALLTGFVAQLSPAQARSCAGADVEIGAVATAVAGQRQRISVASFQEFNRYLDQRQTRVFSGFALSEAPMTASVLTGIDRALQ
jgi:hypothetical protein